MPLAHLLRLASLLNLLALVALCLATELWLAPIRPGGSWLVLKVLPLLLALRGFLYGRRYTYQWMSLLIWGYFTSGILRAWGDAGLASFLGGLEAGLALALFAICCAFAYSSAPSKKTPA